MVMSINPEYTFDQYQEDAMSLRLPSATPAYVVHNLVSEVGEFFGHVAKATRDGPPDDIVEKLRKEVGDMLWSIAGICADNGWSLGDVARENFTKLTDRKNRGKLQGSGDNR